MDKKQIVRTVTPNSNEEKRQWDPKSNFTSQQHCNPSIQIFRKETVSKFQNTYQNNVRKTYESPPANQRKNQKMAIGVDKFSSSGQQMTSQAVNMFCPRSNLPISNPANTQNVAKHRNNHSAQQARYLEYPVLDNFYHRNNTNNFPPSQSGQYHHYIPAHYVYSQPQNFVRYNHFGGGMLPPDMNRLYEHHTQRFCTPPEQKLNFMHPKYYHPLIRPLYHDQAMQQGWQ